MYSIKDSIKHFELLSEYYSKLKENYKANTFLRTAKKLASELNKKVNLPDNYKIDQFPGIGKSSQLELDSFLVSGTSSRLETLKKNISKMKVSPESILDSFILTLSKSEKEEMELWSAIYSIKTVSDLQSKLSECNFSSSLQEKIANLN